MSPDESPPPPAVAGVVIGLLVREEYEALWNLTGGRHLSEAELRDAVASVGQPVLLPPREVWESLEVVAVPETEPPCYDVTIPLWTSSGPAGVGVQVRLVPSPWQTHDHEIHGFPPVDVGPGPWGPPLQPRPRPRQDAPTPPALATPPPERWRTLLTELVHRLVLGDYAGLAGDGYVTGAHDPDDASIGMWIEDYPATLVDLPPEAWDFSDHELLDPDAGVWAVMIDLWTAEEGHSDLSLEATVWDDGETIAAQIDGVRVM